MTDRITSKIISVNSTKLHAHNDILQIVLVLKGTLKVYKVEKCIELHDHEFTFINARIPHYLQGDDTDVICYEIQLNSFTNIFSKIQYVEFITLDEIGTFDEDLKKRVNSVLIDFLLKNHYAQSKSYYFSEKRFYEEQLMLLLFNNYQLITHKKNYGQYYSEDLCDRYYNIIQYIYEHINEKIFAEDILRENPMNQTYFSQFMKKIAGIGFKEYVNYHKLMNIMLLVLEKDLALADIASNVGITDMKSFYHLFKKYYQTSPAQWKKDTSLFHDDYEVISEPNYFVEYLKKYDITNIRKNAMGSLNNYLMTCKANKIDLFDKNISVDPYQYTTLEKMTYYFPYQYFSSVLSLIEYYRINLIFSYDYEYLLPEGEKVLLRNVLSASRFSAGLQELRKWRIVFNVTKLKHYNDAVKLKKEIENSYPGLNVDVIMSVQY